MGDREGKPFKLSTQGGKQKPWGISIIRHEVAYDKTTLFSGYPSKRVWYPFSSDIYQEIIPSMGDAYPYPIKALLLYMGTPVYSLPAGHKLVEILMDPKKIPLIVVSDIVVGETSMYADYIFPDLTYLERWEFSGSHPSVTPKVAPFRQPAVAPLTDTVTVYGEKMPLSMESLILGLAEKLKLPGFGKDGFGPGLHFKRDEDMYLRMVANIAFGDKPDGSEKVPAASAEEIRIFEKSHQFLPATVYDLNRWKAVVGPDTVAPRGLRDQPRRPLPGLRLGLQGRAAGQQVRKAGGDLFRQARNHEALHDRRDLPALCRLHRRAA